ncbi:centrosome-associated protein CEP250-like isoform X2 [Drosophila novamexicana]|uniref:centrosome-associated protein CEP250-like isoform X2 n=1 Tax=Drosophila novamexicana TaxID=47314 RepID=UPI0011E5D1F6|nr:centrosome-associated protein CEP250-like isoform X2 [Drosophila novamexicana]
MELSTWKQVLLKWVRDCELIEPTPVCLDDLEPEIFFPAYAERVKYLRSNPESANSPLLYFLEEKFPNFEPQLKQNGGIAVSDYAYVYSLLWRYASDNGGIDYIPDGVFQDNYIENCIDLFIRYIPDMSNLSRVILHECITRMPLGVQEDSPEHNGNSDSSGCGCGEYVMGEECVSEAADENELDYIEDEAIEEGNSDGAGEESEYIGGEAVEENEPDYIGEDLIEERKSDEPRAVFEYIVKEAVAENENQPDYTENESCKELDSDEVDEESEYFEEAVEENENGQDYVQEYNSDSGASEEAEYLNSPHYKLNETVEEYYSEGAEEDSDYIEEDAEENGNEPNILDEAPEPKKSRTVEEIFKNEPDHIEHEATEEHNPDNETNGEAEAAGGREPDYMDNKAVEEPAYRESIYECNLPANNSLTPTRLLRKRSRSWRTFANNADVPPLPASSSSGVDTEEKYCWMKSDPYENAPPDKDLLGSNNSISNSSPFSNGTERQLRIDNQPNEKVPTKTYSKSRVALIREKASSQSEPSILYNIYTLTTIDTDFLRSSEDEDEDEDEKGDGDNNNDEQLGAKATNAVVQSEKKELGNSSSSKYRSVDENADEFIENEILQLAMVNGNLDKDTLIELLKDHIRALQISNDELSKKVQVSDSNAQSYMKRIHELQDLVDSADEIVMDRERTLEGLRSDCEALKMRLRRGSFELNDTTDDIGVSSEDKAQSAKNQLRGRAEKRNDSSAALASAENERMRFKQKMLRLIRSHNVELPELPLNDNSLPTLFGLIEYTMDQMAAKYESHNQTLAANKTKNVEQAACLAESHNQQEDQPALEGRSVHLDQDPMVLYRQQIQAQDAFAAEMLQILAECNNLAVEPDDEPGAVFHQLRKQLGQFVANYRYLNTQLQSTVPATMDALSAYEANIRKMLLEVENIYNVSSMSQETGMNALEQLRLQIEQFMSDFKGLEATSARLTSEYRSCLKQYSDQQQNMQMEHADRLKLDDYIKYLEEQLDYKTSECNWFGQELTHQIAYINKLESEQNMSEISDEQELHEYHQKLGSVLGRLKAKMINYVCGIVRLNVNLNKPLVIDNQLLVVHQRRLTLLLDEIKNNVMDHIAQIARIVSDSKLPKNEMQQTDEVNQDQNTLVDELQQQLSAAKDQNKQLEQELQSAIQQDNYSVLKQELRITRHELNDMKNENLQLSHRLFVSRRAGESKGLEKQLETYKQYSSELEAKLNDAFDLVNDRNRELERLTNMFNELKVSLTNMDQRVRQACPVEDNSSVLVGQGRDFVELQQHVEYLEQELVISQELSTNKQSELQMQLLEQQKAAAIELDARDSANQQLSEKLEVCRVQVESLECQLKQSQASREHQWQSALLVDQLGGSRGRLQQSSSIWKQLEGLQLQLKKREEQLQAAQVDLQKEQSERQRLAENLTDYQQLVEELQQPSNQDWQMECQLFEAHKEIEVQKKERLRLARAVTQYQQKVEQLQRQLERAKNGKLASGLVDQLEMVMQELQDANCANMQLGRELLSYQEQKANLQEQLTMSQSHNCPSQHEKKLVEKLTIAREEVQKLKVVNHKLVKTARYYRDHAELLQEQMGEMRRRETNAFQNEARLSAAHQDWLEKNLASYKKRVKNLQQQIKERAAQLKDAEQQARKIEHLQKQLTMTQQRLREQPKTVTMDQSGLEDELNTAYHEIIGHASHQKELAQQIASYKERIDHLENQLKDARSSRATASEGEDKGELVKQLEIARRHMYDQDCAQLKLSEKLGNYKMRLENMQEQLQRAQVMKAKVQDELNHAQEHIKAMQSQQLDLQEKLDSSKQETTTAYGQLNDLQQLQLLTLEQLEDLKKQFDKVQQELGHAQEVQAKTVEKLHKAEKRLEKPLEQLAEAEQKLQRIEYVIQEYDALQLERKHLQEQLGEEQQKYLALTEGQTKLVEEKRAEIEREIVKLQKKLELKDFQLEAQKAQISAFERRVEKSPEPISSTHDLAQARRSLVKHKEHLAALRQEKNTLQKDVKAYKEQARCAEQELTAFRQQHARSMEEYTASICDIKRLEKALHMAQFELHSLQAKLALTDNEIIRLTLQVGDLNEAIQLQKLHSAELLQQLCENEDSLAEYKKQMATECEIHNLAQKNLDRTLQELNTLRLRQNLVISHLDVRLGKLQSEGRGIAQREYNSRRTVKSLEVKLAKLRKDLSDMRFSNEGLVLERANYLHRMSAMHRKIEQDRDRMEHLQTKCEQLQEQCDHMKAKRQLTTGMSQTVLSIDPKKTGRKAEHFRRSLD